MTRLRFLPHSGQRSFGQTWRRSAPLHAVGKPTGSKEVVKELVKIVEDTDRGLDVTSAQRKMIEEYVDRLQELGEGQITTGEQMAATWRMLWTTEKASFEFVFWLYFGFNRRLCFLSKMHGSSAKRQATFSKFDSRDVTFV